MSKKQEKSGGIAKSSPLFSHRSSSPNPGSAIASLVFASSSNHVQQHQTLQNKNLEQEFDDGSDGSERRMSLKEELRREKSGTRQQDGKSSCQDSKSGSSSSSRTASSLQEKMMKDKYKNQELVNRRMSDATVPSSAPLSHGRGNKLSSRSESLTAERLPLSSSSSPSPVVPPRINHSTVEQQSCSDKNYYDRSSVELNQQQQQTKSTTFYTVSSAPSSAASLSSTNSSSSARGTLSSPSIVSVTAGGRTSPSPTTTGLVDEEMKNPFKSKKNEASSDVIGHALAGVLTGGAAGSVTSMDTLDPMTGGSAGGNLSVINPILAREARTRSFLVGNLGCHDGILGCEELTRFFPNGKVNIMLITWNMSGNHPPSELNDLLLPETLLYVPDIYAIAMQEMVFGEGKEIETQLQTTIGPSHVLLHSHIHGVLGLLIFVRRDLIWFFSLPEEAAYNVRPASMNMVKTKGAVGVSFSFFGTTFLFINSHLPAHEARNKERKEAYEKIISSFDLPRNLRPLKPRYISSDVTARFDVCFWIGDLNFRVERPYEETIQILEEIKAQRELIKSGCGETGRIKRILGGRFKDTTAVAAGRSGTEDNASNTSLQGSVSSVDSSGLEASGGHGSSSNPKVITRRISEPGTSACHRASADNHSKDNCYECLLRTDQLIKGMEERQIFQGFQEVSEINFAPTFKYDINGDDFDVEYHRVPSYTDRILARSKRPGHVSCLAYDSIPDIKTSDHKPVFALMECQIRPGKDTIPLNAGLFKRDIYIEALRRRAEENFGSPAAASGCGVS